MAVSPKVRIYLYIYIYAYRSGLIIYHPLLVESPAQAPASPEPAASQPSATPTPNPTVSSETHADPDEVDISNHYYAPPTTACPSPRADPANLSEAQLRQMMLGFDRPATGGAGNPSSPMPGTSGGGDPMMEMLQKMMGGGLPGGLPGGADAANLLAGTGLESFLGAAGGPGQPQQQQQQQQTEQSKAGNLWRILHAIFALGLGIYVALSTTYTGTKVERDADDLQSTGMLGAQNLEEARAWFFHIFMSVEAVLLTSRYMVERSATGFAQPDWKWTVTGFLPDPFKRYSRHILRYAQLFTTVRNDALFCVFVMGVCTLLR